MLKEGIRMSGPKSYSPLRYPGGKNKLWKYASNLISSNSLNGCTYVEPYCGGAAVALSLLFNGHVSRIVINDYDRSIYAFWHSVLNFPNELCELITNTDVNIENWYAQRDIQNEKQNCDLLTLGFSTLFLNRTNYSGIIKGGVLGGLNQTGDYKIDCRFNKGKLITKIHQIADFRDRIELYNLDTLDLIENIIPMINNECFIFFDPPYFNKGSQLYVNFYNHDDHLKLSKKISDIDDSIYWIVTYDRTPEIENMYPNRNKVYDLNYSAGKCGKGQEIMFYSDNMILSAECENVV